MEFIDRKKEIARLRSIRDRSRNTACWTILTGRRRVEDYLVRFCARHSRMVQPNRRLKSTFR